MRQQNQRRQIYIVFRSNYGSILLNFRDRRTDPRWQASHIIGDGMLHITVYQWSVVFMCLSCIVSEIFNFD